MPTSARRRASKPLGRPTRPRTRCNVRPVAPCLAAHDNRPVHVDEKYNPWPDYQYTGKLRPVYPLSAKRTVPDTIARPDYADHPRGFPESEMKTKGSHQITVLNAAEIEKMRHVCQVPCPARHRSCMYRLSAGF